ncbi:MAG: helix-turn-helix domain-containing protein, partial [Lachnospiraceae bacterium]|nr:helix-turn-helix domain-containing protein [Lachnospiraceae bacterium]
FEPVLEQYYILEPEHTVGGDNQKHLRINEYVNAGSVSRKDALSKIRATLKENGIRSIFAYNAISDYERLVELATYNWYDIMQVAAYKLYNPAITDEDECHESGRLKKNFGVTDMLERLGGEGSGHENNTIYDARNELEILKLLKRPIGDYVFTRVSDDDSENDLDPESEDLGEDALTASEAEQILGVSRGTVYNLVKRGDIFGYKRGKRYIISEVSVREYLEKQEAAENFRYKSTVSGILLAILFALIYLWHLAAKML